MGGDSGIALFAPVGAPLVFDDEVFVAFVICIIADNHNIVVGSTLAFSISIETDDATLVFFEVP